MGPCVHNIYRGIQGHSREWDIKRTQMTGGPPHSGREPPVAGKTNAFYRLLKLFQNIEGFF